MIITIFNSDGRVLCPTARVLLQASGVLAISRWIELSAGSADVAAKEVLVSLAANQRPCPALAYGDDGRPGDVVMAG